MSLGYVDSSSVLAIILGERRHERVERELRRFDVGVSNGLMEAKIRAALHREGFPETDPEGFPTVIEWIHPDRPLSLEISRALEAGHLKGADLLHVATALFARQATDGALSFLTLDESQRRVAAELGFDTPELG